MCCDVIIMLRSQGNLTLITLRSEKATGEEGGNRMGMGRGKGVEGKGGLGGGKGEDGGENGGGKGEKGEGRKEGRAFGEGKERKEGGGEGGRVQAWDPKRKGITSEKKQWPAENLHTFYLLQIGTQTSFVKDMTSSISPHSLPSPTFSFPALYRTPVTVCCQEHHCLPM